MSKIKALINLKRVDEAEVMLADQNLRGNPATDIDIYRVQEIINGIKQDPLGLGGKNIDPNTKEGDETLKKMIEILENFFMKGGNKNNG